jgi:hypothetical protein
LKDGGYVEMSYNSGRRTQLNGPDPLAPPVGAEVEFRVCDLHAWLLSRHKGLPAIQLYWPIAKRDEAVAACAAFLREHGDQLKSSGGKSRAGDSKPN